MKEAVLETPPKVAVKVAGTEAETAKVETGKETLLAPGGTVTCPEGVLKAEPVPEIFTTAPLGPAGPERVTVAIIESPPTTVVGVTNPPSEIGKTVNDLETVLLNFATTVTGVVESTNWVETANKAVSLPAGRVTTAGALAHAGELPTCTATVNPAVFTVFLSVIVPTALCPAITLAGETVSNKGETGISEITLLV